MRTGPFRSMADGLSSQGSGCRRQRARSVARKSRGEINSGLWSTGGFALNICTVPLPKMYEKNKRWRQKMIRLNLCPHCGKDPFPWAECEQRRKMKRLYYLMRRFVALGVAERIGRGRFRHTGNEDSLSRKRAFYKTNDLGRLPSGLRKCLEQIDDPAATDILSQFPARKVKIKSSGGPKT